MCFKVFTWANLLYHFMVGLQKMEEDKDESVADKGLAEETNKRKHSQVTR